MITKKLLAISCLFLSLPVCAMKRGGRVGRRALAHSSLMRSKYFGRKHLSTTKVICDFPKDWTAESLFNDMIQTDKEIEEIKNEIRPSFISFYAFTSDIFNGVLYLEKIQKVRSYLSYKKDLAKIKDPDLYGKAIEMYLEHSDLEHSDNEEKGDQEILKKPGETKGMYNYRKLYDIKN